MFRCKYHGSEVKIQGRGGSYEGFWAQNLIQQYMTVQVSIHKLESLRVLKSMKTASGDFWRGDEIVKKALRTKKTKMSNYITLT